MECDYCENEAEYEVMLNCWVRWKLESQEEDKHNWNFDFVFNKGGINYLCKECVIEKGFSEGLQNVPNDKVDL